MAASGSSEYPTGSGASFGPGLYAAACWLLTVAVWAVVWVANGRSEWLAGSLLRYLALMLSAAASVAASLKRPWPVVAALPILLGASFSTVPEIGYGGQIAALGVAGALGSGGLAAVAIAARNRSALHSGSALSGGFALSLIAIQIAIVAPGLGFTGGFALLADVQHRGLPIDVRSVRLGSVWHGGTNRLSRAYAGDGWILIVDEAGRLHRLDVDTLDTLNRVPLPLPRPADYGLEPALPEHEARAALPWLAEIMPLGGSRFRIAFPLAAERPAIGDQPARPFWRVEIDVDLDTGQTLRTEVVEGEVNAGWGVTRPVGLGEFSIVWGDFGNSLRATGPGVDTRIWPAGAVNWVEVAGPRVFVATDRGVLYIVAPPGPGPGGAVRGSPGRALL
jgi:hypothetical protein